MKPVFMAFAWICGEMNEREVLVVHMVKCAHDSHGKRVFEAIYLFTGILAVISSR